jgi:mxaK protein
MAIGIKRGLTIALPLALAASLVGLAVSAHALYQSRAVNDLIRHGNLPKIEDGVPPEVLFAKAYQLRHNGNLDAALELYHQLERVPNRDFQVKVNYNIGNIYITRAQLEAQSARIKDISTLVGIARAQYQHALHLDSHFYDAKYNLEYTRFLVMERELEEKEYEGGLGRHNDRRTQWAEFYQMPQGLP